MNNTQNTDPILRTVLIVFAGLIVFGALFGYNFGGTGASAMSGGGHHGTNSSGNLFFANMISSLLAFTINILLLVVVFALVAGLILAVKKFMSQSQSDGGFFATSRTQVMDAVNQDPILKTLLLVFVGIVGFYLLMGLFSGGGFIAGSPHLLSVMLFGFLMKLLVLAFVISLTLALVQYIKAQSAQPSPSDGSSQGSPINRISQENQSSDKNQLMEINESDDQSKG